MTSTLTNRTLPIAGALVAVALVAAVLVSASGRNDSAVAQETDASRTINVSGEGRVSLPPDVVMMDLGVSVRDEDLGAAQTQAAEQMRSVIDALRAAGVAEDDIQTSNYSIYAERDYNQPEQPLIGYTVSQTVVAKVRDLDNAGTVIEAAVEAGANQVNNVWFALENPDEAVRQARELAVQNAREKAEELARLTDSTLGPVQTVSEGYSPSPPPVPYADYGRAESADAAAAPPINPGQTEVVLTVNVSYAIQ